MNRRGVAVTMVVGFPAKYSTTTAVRVLGGVVGVDEVTIPVRMPSCTKYSSNTVISMAMVVVSDAVVAAS